jgi:hypothetical protein
MISCARDATSYEAGNGLSATAFAYVACSKSLCILCFVAILSAMPVSMTQGGRHVNMLSTFSGARYVGIVGVRDGQMLKL